MGDQRRTNPRTHLSPSSCARRAAPPARLTPACWAGAAGGIQVQACVAPTVTAPNAGSVDRSFLKIGLD
jgi:hypothetical protein